MNENQQNQLNTLYDQLFARLQGEIKRVPLKDLQHVVGLLLHMKDFNMHTQQAESNHKRSDQILSEVVKSMRDGNNMPPGMIIPPDDLNG